jgi:hypothetical protein
MDQDVLGYDNETSMNHNWDPRFQIFIDSNYLPRKDELTEFFLDKSSTDLIGIFKNFSDSGIDGTHRVELTKKNVVNHLIEMSELELLMDLEWK